MTEKNYEYAVQCKIMCGNGAHWFVVSEWRKDRGYAINDWFCVKARNPDFSYEARCVRREVGALEFVGSL